MLNKKNILIQKINKLKNFAVDLKNENLNDNLDAFLKEIQKDLTFNVLCLGDFSSGKSTFINRFFIEKDVLPTNVTTTTAKLTIIKYGEKEKIAIHYKEGEKKEYYEDFENILKNAVAKGGEEVENIDFVEVFIPSSILKDGIIIVDSPGLNDPESERMKITYDYLERADSVLYLLTALQAWKRSEKEFLEEKVLRKEDLDKIFFLLNFWDMIKDDEKDDLLSFVKGQMRQSLKITEAELGVKLSEPPLIPISSKTKENFELLKKELWSYLESRKGQAILESKYKKLEVFKNKIKSLIIEEINMQEKEKKEIEHSLTELKDEIDKLKNEVKEFKDNLKEKVEIIIDELFSEIEEYSKNLKEKIILRIKRRIEEVKDLNDLEKLIRESIDKVVYIEKKNFEACYLKFYKKIENIIEKEKSRLELDKYFLKSKTLDIEEIKKLKKSDIPIDTDYTMDILITGGSVISALVLASIANPVLAIFALPGIAYNIFYRQKKEKQEILRTISILEEEIEENLLDSINQLKLKKDEIVDYILDNIKNELIEAYKEKEKIYKKILEDKENNKENEIIELYKNKLQELESI